MSAVSSSRLLGDRWFPLRLPLQTIGYRALGHLDKIVWMRQMIQRTAASAELPVVS